MSTEKNGAQGEAISNYQKLLETYPDHIPSHYNLARLFAQQPDWPNAIQHLEKVTTLAPQFPAGFYNLAIAYLQTQAIANAISALENALIIYPDYIEAHQMLGGIAFKQQHWETAQLHFDVILAIDPYHATAHLNKGILLLQQHDLTGAESHLQQALDIDPTLSEAYYHLGVIAQAQQKNDAAITYFENAYDRDPKHFGACYNLGLLYKEKNQFKIAQRYFALAKALQPDNPHVAFMEAALSQTQLPIKAPATFVAELFDHYAPYYDTHLTETLQYQVPMALRDAVLENLPNPPEQIDILDLGCGTGLSGLPFKAWAKNLIGVDISSAMLKIAKGRNVYTELHQQDVFDYLKTKEAQFDIIIAADLFGYIGALEDFFSLAARLLKPGGWLVFSAEITIEQDYQLQTCARFAHRLDYFTRLAQQHGLALHFNKPIVLRYQNKVPVEGRILGLTHL